MKTALIVQGGWQGHQPAEMAELLAAQLRKHDFHTTISDTLDAFCDPNLASLDLIVPIWTMGTIKPEQLNPLLEAVRSGFGVAGVHGGMADAFRNETEYQFMVGGQWVAHPGGDSVTYTVHINGEPSSITEGIQDFTVTSEQYYMHIDPRSPCWQPPGSAMWSCLSPGRNITARGGSSTCRSATRLTWLASRRRSR